MYIRKIEIENIRGFEKLELDLTRPDGSLAGWTVAAGRNGSGKTTLLKAIARRALGQAPPHGRCPRRSGAPQAPGSAMRRLLRLPLSRETRALLERRVRQIEEAGPAHAAPADRARDVGRTRRGEESIRVYGLGRGPLVKMRRATWDSIQIHIIAYAMDCAQGELERAGKLREALCAHPHASVLLHLLTVLDGPAGPGLIRRECIAAIEAHPEIRGWLVVPSSA